MPYWLYAVTLTVLILGGGIAYFRDIVRSPELRLTVWLLLFFPIPVLVALLVIESGAFIVEQNRFGYLNGATLFYFGYVVLFYVTVRVGYLFGRSVLPTYGQGTGPIALDKVLGWSVCVGALILLYANYLLSPKPFFNAGIDKFNYWDSSALRSLSSLMGNVSSFIPVGLGVLHQNTKRKQYTVLGLILYVTYLVLVGQKFGPIVNALIFFSTPQLLETMDLRKLVRRYWAPASFAAVVLGTIAYSNYAFFNPYAYAGLSVLGALVQRAFVLQGHVFWGSVVFSGVYQYGWSMDSFVNGMRTMMLLVSPLPGAALQQAYAEGRSFTGAYPAILNVLFPLPIRILTHVLVAFGYGVFLRVVAIHFKKRRVFMSMIAIQVFMWTNYMLTMGKFSYLMDYRFWFLLAAVVLGAIPGLRRSSERRI